MSEPHTSELNSGFSLIYIYIYMYICIVCHTSFHIFLTQEGRGLGTSFTACSVVLSPNPTYERGSGDIRLIPRASLTLITFWRDISLRQ